jgi:hypothetical protein
MKRKNNINYSYFNSIDTEYKAYILGFIYADGTIDDKIKGNRQKRLKISIQEEDSYILDKLLLDINGNKTITRYPKSSIENNWKKQKSASVASNEICNDLISLGCYPRKSTVGMKFPKIPENLMNHFIRGFFDGDGCITVNKKIYRGKKVTSENFKIKLAFTSTDKDFLNTLCSYLPITKIYKTEKLRKMIVYTYWIERKQDIENVQEYLYKNANYFLKRKFDKFYMPIKSQVIDTSIKGLTTT